MSNGIIQASDDDTARVEQWVHIDDFSPGVWDGSFVATAEPIISAPLGGANAEGTWCCASLPGGGLGPLPALVAQYAYSGGGTPNTPTWITGFASNVGSDADGTELVILTESDNGTDHFLDYWSFYPDVATTNAILSAFAATQPGYFGSPYPTWTRMLSVGESTAGPVLVFPASMIHDANGNAGHIFVYPSLAAPSTYSCSDMVDPATPTNNAGQTIAYGSRILALVGIDYDHPAVDFNTNENISFTDPPLTGDYLQTAPTILAAEAPWGYGAWGSISTGELCLIKKNGGAVVVEGGIDAPAAVIQLPGVQATGFFVGHSDATPTGLIYCSEDQGAWLWNGGNLAQKISRQLRDNFYDVAKAAGFASNNYGFFCYHWQDWVLFSNNYMFNSDTGAWWVLWPSDVNGDANTPGHTFFHYAIGQTANVMFAAPLRFGNNTGGLTREWVYRFDNTSGAPHWRWQSLPIHVVPTADRVVDVRQIVLRLSSPDGTSTATATIQIGSFEVTTSGTIGPNPTTFRFNVGVGALGLEDIILEIAGDNASGSAPILHSIDVGYNIRAGVGADN